MKSMCIIFLFLTSAAFSTELKGVVSGSLALEDSPFYVVGDVVVPPDAHLTIEAGVILKFDSTVVFRVEGKLTAKGADGRKIVFTASKKNPQGAAWEGVQFTNRSNDQSSLEYCRIEFARRGVSLFSVSPTITQCEIVNNSEDGIRCQVCQSMISENIIKGNGGDGIFAKAMKGNILNNELSENNGDGVHLENSPCLVAENKLRLNGDDGVFCRQSSAIIRDNFIMQNKDDGVLIEGASPKIMNNVIARHQFGVFGYHDAAPVIANCTIADNIYGLYGRSKTSFRMDNSIVWNNETSVFVDSLSSAEITFSDVEGGYAGSGNFSKDPKFIDAKDYQLKPDSPCLGRSNPDALIIDEKTKSTNIGARFK